MPAARQTLFYSATMETSVKHLVETHVKNPVRIELGSGWSCDSPAPCRHDVALSSGGDLVAGWHQAALVSAALCAVGAAVALCCRVSPPAGTRS